MTGARIALPRLWRVPRSRRRRRAVSRPRLRGRTLVLAALTLALLAAGGLWLRDSSLLVIRHARLDAPPLVPASVLPRGDRVLDRHALDGFALAGAAPTALRRLIVRVRAGGHDGLRADMRGGLRIVFGSPDRLEAKWAAAVSVIADPQAAGASALDVRVPERPVADNPQPQP